MGKLEDGKEGTFEWVDIVLAVAMARGSWLADNSNTCSASVPVVSERGMLEGQVVTVPRLKDDRVLTV